MNVSRRTILSGIAAIPAVAGAGELLAGSEPAAHQRPSIDHFLATASATDRARYHANALADVMQEIYPEAFYTATIDYEHRFALIVDRAS
ncbi:hypothetical protein [Chelativorans sp. J32]|uniref:hypothetical protein n=1 Tax=Chelativorans sp. J32 TaxID=935840 RepID=UPI0004832E11|nr:hypothetical protein [Chelativorans sp. J32]